MKEIRLKDLEKSHEAGAITKEEYERKKKEIEESPEEKSEVEQQEPKKEPTLKSEWMLFLIIGVVVVVLGGLLAWAYLKSKEPPKTIDELHDLNFAGELKPEQGFIYNGQYSFVVQDNVWYTRFTSPSKKILYNLNFRYSPKELENISISGQFDWDMFNNASEYYVTFNPLGKDFTYLRLARFDYDSQMLRVFDKTPKSACDRDASNQTDACSGIPIITCENKTDIVLYFKEGDEMNVAYDKNCIIIEGREFDFVKGVDRILYQMYGIMV